MSDTAQNSQNVGLTLDDIRLVAGIIDHACEQGAFKGWQVIEQVILQRNRLKAFLDAADAADAAKAAAEAVPPAPTGEPAPEPAAPVGPETQG